MNYGEKIARLRKTNGMTQSELGDALNVSYQAVSKWERDESRPDFETMCRIARLFGVSITYFEDAEEEIAATAEAEEEAQESFAPKVLVGTCTECGKAIFENDEYASVPKLRCKECNEAILARAQEEQKRQEEEQKRERERQKNEAIKKEAQIRKRVKRGLLIGLIPAAALLACGIAFCATTKDFLNVALAFTFLLPVFGYAFGAQLCWDGTVREVCLGGGFIANMPGVIFSFDLDGFIFLIAMKILFAILKFLLFLLSILACAIAAFFISPFTFVPALIHAKNGKI